MSAEGKNGGQGQTKTPGPADAKAASDFAKKADATLNVKVDPTVDAAAALVKCSLNLTGEPYGADVSADLCAGLLDVGSGKDGVMSRRDADALERRVMSKIEFGEGLNLANTEDDVLRRSFLIAFRLYLAMHSSENADDGSGAIEDGVTFTFGATTLSGALVKTAAQMASFHRYLRCRADEVRDAIKFTLARAGSVGAATHFPLACETARLLRVQATTRFMPDYPQYAFVGAEYCSTVTPRVREVINASKTALLAAQRAPEARSAHKFAHGSKADAALPVLPDF